MADVQQQSLYIFHPSSPAAIVAFVIIAVLLLGHYIQLFRLRAWVLIWLVIGTKIECLGLFSRMWSITHEDNITANLVGYLVPIIAPTYLAAACFVVFGRVVLAVTPTLNLSFRTLLISPRWIVTLLLLFTLATFLVQILGIGLIVNAFHMQTLNFDPALMPQADRTIMVALIIQTFGFALFALVSANFMLRSRNWPSPPGMQWKRLAWGTNGAAALLMFRGLYRIVEFSDPDPNSYIRAHEWCFYVFDVLPVIGSLLVFAVIHPGCCLPREYIGVFLAVKYLLRQRHGQAVESTHAHDMQTAYESVPARHKASEV